MKAPKEFLNYPVQRLPIEPVPAFVVRISPPLFKVLERLSKPRMRRRDVPVVRKLPELIPPNENLA